MYSPRRTFCHFCEMCLDSINDGTALCPISMLVAKNTTKKTANQMLVSILPISLHSELPREAGSTSHPCRSYLPLKASSVSLIYAYLDASRVRKKLSHRCVSCQGLQYWHYEMFWSLVLLNLSRLFHVLYMSNQYSICNLPKGKILRPCW